MDRATELSIKDLTLKLVMLSALITAGREQTLHLLNLKGMVKDDSCIVFVASSNIKQSRPTSSLTERIVKLRWLTTVFRGFFFAESSTHAHTSEISSQRAENTREY